MNHSDREPSHPSIGVKEFWRVLGERAVGATIVTASDANGRAGLLALSVAHVSADPPIVLVSVDHRTSARNTIREAGHFAVNILADSSLETAQRFGGAGPLKGADRFEDGRWSQLTTGAPIFLDALAALDCLVEECVERPTTAIFLGRVVASMSKGEGRPLVYFRGAYTSLG